MKPERDPEKHDGFYTVDTSCGNVDAGLYHLTITTIDPFDVRRYSFVINRMC